MKKRVYSQPKTKVMLKAVSYDVCEDIIVASVVYGPPPIEEPVEPVKDLF